MQISSQQPTLSLIHLRGFNKKFPKGIDNFDTCIANLRRLTNVGDIFHHIKSHFFRDVIYPIKTIFVPSIIGGLFQDS